MQSCLHWGQIMKESLKKRVSLASCWASTRISILDGLERFEDSYAITQEFREWITCASDHPEQLESSVLPSPASLNDLAVETSNDTDEVLEI